MLYEIQNTEHCTAKMLIDKLSIDAGYLSRILKRFDKLGLTYRVQSDKDGRSYYHYLSDQGREMLHKLDALSDEQVRRLIEGLPEHRKGLIAKSMTAVKAPSPAKRIAARAWSSAPSCDRGTLAF